MEEHEHEESCWLPPVGQEVKKVLIIWKICLAHHDYYFSSELGIGVFPNISILGKKTISSIWNWKPVKVQPSFVDPGKMMNWNFYYFFESDLSKEYILQLTGEVSPTTHLCIIP